MADIYGTDSKLGGVFKGTSFAMSIGGAGGNLRGALVQQLQVNYRRQITRVWELGSRDQFYIEGHTEGMAQLQRIVGPNGLVDGITRALSDICSSASRALSLSAANNACAGTLAGGGTISLESPVTTNFSLGATVQNFVVDSGLELTFTGLQA